MNISKREFVIPVDAKIQINEKGQKYFIDNNENKVILLEDGKMVVNKDETMVTFYHLVNGEYIKHRYHLRDKRK